MGFSLVNHPAIGGSPNFRKPPYLYCNMSFKNSRLKSLMLVESWVMALRSPRRVVQEVVDHGLKTGLECGPFKESSKRLVVFKFTLPKNNMGLENAICFEEENAIKCIWVLWSVQEIEPPPRELAPNDPIIKQCIGVKIECPRIWIATKCKF